MPRPSTSLLWGAAVVAGLTLLARAWAGPFQFVWSVRSPLNAAGFFSLAILLLLLVKRAPTQPQATPPTSLDLRWAGSVILITALAMWPSMNAGFVADDYAHLFSISRAGWSEAWAWFTVPAADRFYRPTAMLWYWAEWHWAGLVEWKWQVGGALLNGLNAGLLFAIAGQLGLRRGWAAFAALLFGLHGARPEAVTWMAARFDLLATLSVLSAVLLFLRAGAANLAWRGPVFALCSAWGLLSKESAFVLPGLLLACLWLDPTRRTRSGWSLLAISVGTAAAVFALRWWVLDGWGGYRDDSGRSTVLDFRPWLFIKALAFRLPAVLMVPLNWTGGLNRWLCLALTGMVMANWLAAAGASSSSHASRLCRLGACWMLLAALPVYHLLQILEDLERSRVVYLSAAGFALLLASRCQEMGRVRSVVCAALLLLFHLSALGHNNGYYGRMSAVHAVACRQVAAAASVQQIHLFGLPTTLDGVYLLTTGLPECVELRHGVKRARVMLVERRDQAPAGARLWAWDSARRQIIAVPPE